MGMEYEKDPQESANFLFAYVAYVSEGEQYNASSILLFLFLFVFISSHLHCQRHKILALFESTTTCMHFVSCILLDYFNRTILIKAFFHHTLHLQRQHSFCSHVGSDPFSSASFRGDHDDDGEDASRAPS